jgi:hypothetical protein
MRTQWMIGVLSEFSVETELPIINIFDLDQMLKLDVGVLVTSDIKHQAQDGSRATTVVVVLSFNIVRCRGPVPNNEGYSITDQSAPICQQYGIFTHCTLLPTNALKNDFLTGTFAMLCYTGTRTLSIVTRASYHATTQSNPC